MNTTADPAPDPVAEPAPAQEGSRCVFCDSILQPDQEWCLECGAARTVIRTAPDWRIPALIVGGIIVAGVVAFVIALVHLGDQGSSLIPVPATSQRAATAGARVGSWPPGLSGWTILIGNAPNQAAADATARQLVASGIPAGVLYSSQHPLLRPNVWVVYAGRYPTRAQARAAARRLAASGRHVATMQVAKPGGI